MKLTENWDKLTPQEKYEARFNAFINPDIPFASPEVEQAYKKRAQMMKDVIELKKNDRVPVSLVVGFYPATYAGMTAYDMMYDYDKLDAAFRKFNADFDSDTLVSCFLSGPGKVFEALEYKLYQWPGHGTPKDASYQCVEKEYMLDDEYDLLINDPSSYWMRCYLPRTFGAFEPWQALPPWTDLIELPFVGATMIPFGLPHVQESFKKLMAAGQAALEWIGAVGAIDGGNIATLGKVPVFGGFAKAPFDTLGDTMRGTKHIMLDMFRRPKKLLEALDRLVSVNVDMGVRSATANRHPVVFIPLHKGADGFLSNADFAKYYWPTLKAVIDGLVNEGIVPYLFVEGSYNRRLDFLAEAEIPEGKTIWIFDDTDMIKAKKALGGRACIGGNVSGSMLKAGTPVEVEEYVKFLMENVAQDGGFILTNGVVIEDANDENVQAMVKAGLKYGQYR